MSDSDDDIPPYSDLSSVSSDSSDRVRGNLFIRVLNKADRVRGKTEDLLNDIHESYSFDLDPEYRLKLQKAVRRMGYRRQVRLQVRRLQGQGQERAEAGGQGGVQILAMV
jgi:hypothetical protein